MGGCCEGICGGGGATSRTTAFSSRSAGGDVTKREAEARTSKMYFAHEVLNPKEGGEHRDRTQNIISRWISRGAARPIDDFYDSVCQLGEGAYGTVMKMKARHNEGEDFEHHQQHGVEGMYYAVKQVNWKNVWHNRNRDQAKEDQIRAELRTLIGMDHPNVVKFREWFEDKTTGIFFVMELCEGATLQDILDDVCHMSRPEKRLQEMDRMKGYFRQLTYALSYIHDRKIVHRDLKPDNVMLQAIDQTSDIKLIDFGLAAEHLNEGEGDEWQQGTLPFMAPEIFLSNHGDYTTQSDMWALGVLFAWIVTSLYMGSQQHPILPKDKGVNFDVQYYDLLCAMRERAPLNPELFEGCEHSVSKVADALLVHDPDKRPTAAELLNSGWDWLVHDQDEFKGTTEKLLQDGSMLENIRLWQQLSKFDRTVLSLVADHANETQVRDLARVFRALDTERNGRLSKDELRKGFDKMNVAFPEEEMSAIFKVMDTADSGYIDYNEWLSVTIGQSVLKSTSAVNTAFQCLDASGTGEINTEDLEQAIGRQEAEKIFDEYKVRSLDRKTFSSVVQRVAFKRAQTILLPPATEESDVPTRQASSRGFQALSGIAPSSALMSRKSGGLSSSRQTSSRQVSNSAGGTPKMTTLSTMATES